MNSNEQTIRPDTDIYWIVHLWAGTTSVENMLQTIKLLLPALMPSWRFFAAIAPSPRIELALLKTAKDVPDVWQEFRPRPEHLSIIRDRKSVV